MRKRQYIPSRNEVNDRLFSWQFAVVAIVVVVVIGGWPQINEWLTTVTDEKATQPIPDQPVPEPVKDVPPQGFRFVLNEAARLDRQGERQQAHSRYQSLLAQIDSLTASDKATLLTDAATFYGKGHELSAKEVESLFTNAYLATKKIPGNIQDLEIIHNGLEKHYLSQQRYREAAVQTRMLLEHFREVHRDPDLFYAMGKPTMMRLGQHLMAAEQTAQARSVYEAVLTMEQKRGQSTTYIEQLIANTHLPEAERKAPESAFRLVAPPGLKYPKAGSATEPVPVVAPEPVVMADLDAAVENIRFEGLHIEIMHADAKRIKIGGYADNNQLVARYLRKIAALGAKPELDQVSTEQRNQREVSTFSITVDKN